MIHSNLAIQSWCFREYKTTASVIRGLKNCGVSAVELCGVHISADSPDSTLAEYRAAGIDVTAYGVNYFPADEAVCRKYFEVARKAGLDSLNADFPPESIPLLEKLCKEYGVKIAIHNHGRKHRLGAPWALDEVFAKTSPAFGLCLDTAWMLDSGEDPVAAAQKYRKRLFGIHIKDFVFDRAGKPSDVIVGSGCLDLKKLIGFLSDTDYSGTFTLEYEGDSGNPEPALAECVRSMKKLI